jgi:hypothetical protein
MTAGHQLNSRIGDPEWEEPMVVEFTYPQITGDLGGINEEEAFNFPIQLQAHYIKKT